MIIEVMLSLSMVVVLVVVIGNTLGAVHRLEESSKFRAQALDYAKQAVDIVSSMSASATSATNENPFVCHTATAGTACTAADGQACTPISTAYNSCWVDRPIGLATNSDLHLDSSSGKWKLVTSAPPNEVRAPFSRTINIANDATTSNVKTVTVTVNWADRSGPHSLALSTVLSAWKNL
jgi:hypothetical protein